MIASAHRTEPAEERLCARRQSRRPVRPRCTSAPLSTADGHTCRVKLGFGPNLTFRTHAPLDCFTPKERKGGSACSTPMCRGAGIVWLVLSSRPLECLDFQAAGFHRQQQGESRWIEAPAAGDRQSKARPFKCSAMRTRSPGVFSQRVWSFMVRVRQCLIIE